ncbi:hypothetical protein [Nonomuraea guangzhouensis]|uniref:GAF domain-containing protein n=1 Tax=Nonomuraea guangzhouensis TaxID=1291555 RepID=A0ABW4GJQ5_9ACTN|nr:hypothetical protein [Nonomuraea guangzhouensis]
MPYNRVDVAMRELIASFSCLDSAGLIDRLSRTAAAVTGTAYAGFVRVDALREVAHTVNVHAPPVDPLRVLPWLEESGVLKTLASASGPVLIVPDPSMGEPGFLAMPLPLATRDHAFLWVAGRRFGDPDEHLLSRFATAAGRALEAVSGLEAAVRLLRGVQAFPRG